MSATCSSNPDRGIAILAIVACSACWGVTSVFTKALIDVATPMKLVTVQLSASAAFLWLAAILRAGPSGLGGIKLRNAIPGLLDPGLSYIFGTIGLGLTTASSASLITSLQPLLVLVCAALLLGERLGAGGAAAALLGLLGVLSMQGSAGSAESRSSGDLLVLLSACSAALYCVGTRDMARREEPLVLAALHQSAGLVPIAAFCALCADGGAPLGEWLLWACLTGVAQYALSLWLYLYAVSRLPLQTAALFLISIPLFSVVAAWLVLGEILSPFEYAGAAAIVCALVISCRSAGESSVAESLGDGVGDDRQVPAGHRSDADAPAVHHVDALLVTQLVDDLFAEPRV